MLKRILKNGLVLGLFGLIYWVFLLIPIPILFSRVVTIIMDILLVLLWIKLNYTTFSDTNDYSVSMKIIQLYTIPFFVFIIGLIGEYFKITILSAMFSIYFMPFFDILVMFFNKIFNITNYLIFPIFIMLIISLLTYILYRSRTKSKRYN